MNLIPFLMMGVLLVSPSMVSAQGTQPSKEWKTYGAAITLKKAADFTEVIEKKEKYANKDILLEGTVLEVCQNKGCWMVFSQSGRTVRVEFKDYGFFVPWDSEGKRVKMQGTMREKTVSAAAAKHMAGEMENPPIKMEDIGEKNVITVFVATAVAIEGGSEIGEEQQEIIEGKKQREGHEPEDHDDHDHHHD